MSTENTNPEVQEELVENTMMDPKQGDFIANLTKTRKRNINYLMDKFIEFEIFRISDAKLNDALVAFGQLDEMAPILVGRDLNAVEVAAFGISAGIVKPDAFPVTPAISKLNLLINAIGYALSGAENPQTIYEKILVSKFNMYYTDQQLDLESVTFLVGETRTLVDFLNQPHDAAIDAVLVGLGLLEPKKEPAKKPRARRKTAAKAKATSATTEEKK